MATVCLMQKNKFLKEQIVVGVHAVCVAAMRATFGLTVAVV